MTVTLSDKGRRQIDRYGASLLGFPPLPTSSERSHNQVVALRGGYSRRSMARSRRVASCVGHSLHAASNATYASATLVDSNHETLASIIVTFAQRAQD